MTTAQVSEDRRNDTGAPTADAPELGDIRVDPGTGEYIRLSEVELWISDGQWIVRSREFDCVGQGKSRDRAMTSFVANCFAYARRLGELIDEGAATEAEEQAYIELRHRLFGLMLAEHTTPRQKRSLFDRLTGGGPPAAPSIALR